MANLTEQDVRAIIRDEIRKAFGLNTSDRDLEFLPTSKAWQKLGYESRKQLIGAIKSGDLREGKEYQDRSSYNSQKPLYYFNINACIKRLNTPREKRGQVL